MYLTLLQAVLGAIFVLLALLSWRVYQNCFLSPISSVPGPLLAKLTGYWLILIDLAGKRTATIDKLHQKYGTAVRIGPDEISFSGVETIKELYGQQTQYMKSPIYETFVLPPFGIFSMRDRVVHGNRRRLLSHAFSLASLYDTEPTINIFIEKVLLRLENTAGRAIDMLATFRCLSLDIVGELFLGHSFGALDQSDPPPFMKDMDMHFINMAIRNLLPTIYFVLSILPVPAVQDLLESSQRIVEYGRKEFYKYIDIHGRQSKRRDLLTKIVNEKPEGEGQGLSDLAAYTELSQMVYAGTDTTSTTLTYMFWELARNPMWQDKLRDELKSHSMTNGAKLPSYSNLVDLPILDAIINESLRLHPPAPGSLPRTVPVGGRTIDSYFIPEGTIVSMQCHTTQRDPTAFPDPHTWNPSRWLTGSMDARAKVLFMPFSKGPRACLGKNLALMELKLTVAALVAKTKVNLAPGTTEESMAMFDHFLTLPVAGKCDLIFEKV